MTLAEKAAEFTASDDLEEEEAEEAADEAAAATLLAALWRLTENWELRAEVAEEKAVAKEAEAERRESVGVGTPEEEPIAVFMEPVGAEAVAMEPVAIESVAMESVAVAVA